MKVKNVLSTIRSEIAKNERSLKLVDRVLKALQADMDAVLRQTKSTYNATEKDRKLKSLRVQRLRVSGSKLEVRIQGILALGLNAAEEPAVFKRVRRLLWPQVVSALKALDPDSLLQVRRPLDLFHTDPLGRVGNFEAGTD